MDPLVKPPTISIADAQAKLDNPQFTKLALEVLGGLPGWIQPITARVQALRPLEGSRFEDDDSLKPVNPPSEQVLNLLRSALDHLHAVSDAVNGSGPRPLAAFTLIRSAVEASALAAWLMLPGTKDARLKNSIRLSVENRRATETYNTRFDLGDEVTKWFRKEMTATKDQRPGTKNMDLRKRFPNLSSIVNETAKKQKWNALTALDVWRACSGIAHSNAQFAGAATDRIETDTAVMVTLKPTTLLMMLQPAQQFLEYSVELAELHMAGPAAGIQAAARALGQSAKQQGAVAN